MGKPAGASDEGERGRAGSASPDATRGRAQDPATIAFAGIAGVFRAWLPLAASWMLMGLELPLVSAVVARLPDQDVQLAAYGSVILPVALVIEAPIIMLLAASTALSRDRASHRALSQFCHRTSALLTVLHLLVVATPLYELVVGDLLGAPATVVVAARPGLAVMLPWTWAIAYRRLQQGVLIRFGRPRGVTEGTAVRLGGMLSIAWVGWLGPLAGQLAGASLAACAVVGGVVAEAVYIGLRARPVIRAELAHDDPGRPPLRGRAFFDFYAPLAMTALITLIAQPLASAGIARMPAVLPSLAVMPVLIGLILIVHAFGLALSEVVVAGLDYPGARPVLRRFAILLTLVSAGALALVAFTPLAELWFGRISGLDAELLALAKLALLVAIPIPPLRVVQSYFEALLVHAQTTRAIGEAVVVFLLVAALVLGLGIASQRWVGAVVALLALSVGRGAQVGWLWLRNRMAAG